MIEITARSGCVLVAVALGMGSLFVRVAEAADASVTLSNFMFQPAQVTIVEGDSVTWTNTQGQHNVTADDGDFRCANGCDGQGGNGDPSFPPWSITLVFGDPGEVPYFCELHGAAGGVGMSGTVTVLEALIFSDGFESGDTSAWSGTVP